MEIKVIEKWRDNSGGGNSVGEINVDEFNVKECVEEFFGDYFAEYVDRIEWTESEDCIEVEVKGEGINYYFVKLDKK